MPQKPAVVKCVVNGCHNLYPPHRWGRIRAASDGWFIQRGGESWCPKHIPDWVETWRESQDK